MKPQPTTTNEVEQWGIFEWSMQGTMEGNPYTDISLTAHFSKGYRKQDITGFYDGNGTYKIRFMPDDLGEWTFHTSSNDTALNGLKGSFTCIPATSGNHGPVRVSGNYHFVYADGSPYAPFGTTCYGWASSGDELAEQTLKVLSEAPFNKVRMTVLDQKEGRKQILPFAGSFEEGFDFRTFNPDFFHHFEQRIVQLGELGIEADLILFHPYNKKNGLTRLMNANDDDFYLKYVLARFSAFRNVWWSVANEYDLVLTKDTNDWERLINIVSEYDPYRHLCSIHNSQVIFDHRHPGLTHMSIQCQSYDKWNRLTESIPDWREQYRKPVILDECGYEGHASRFWGSVSPQEFVRRCWHGIVMGGYVGHGEAHSTGKGVWTGNGVNLIGDSPERIAFLRHVIENAPAQRLEPQTLGRHIPCVGKPKQYYLAYLGINQPKDLEILLPTNGSYQIEVIDTWEMTITPIDGTFSGHCRFPLPAKPYMAFQITLVP